MAFTNTKESGLEALIVKWLVEQNDYEQGTNADYNRDYAIDETRLFRFLQDTQPDALDKLGVFKTDMKKKQFLNRLQGEIAKRGVIDVLRNRVKVYPANLIMFYLTPTENNAKAKEMYEKNIFIDITAYKDELPPRILVQVKSQDSDIKEATIQSLKGAMREGDYGLFVTLSNYTKNAKKYLDNTPIIRGINGTELVDLVLKYYHDLSDKYKKMIPLKMVYIPVAKEE